MERTRSLYLHPETIHHYNRMLADVRINGGTLVVPSVILMNELVGELKKITREGRDQSDYPVTIGFGIG